MSVGRVLLSALALSFALGASVLASCAAGDNDPATDGSKPGMEADSRLASEGDGEGTQDAPDPPASTSEKNKDASFDDVPDSAVVDVAAFKERLEEGGVFVLDVRPVSKFARESIEGGKNIPAGKILDIRMDEVPKDLPVYVIDEANERLGEAYFTLLHNGYDAERLFVVDGGMEAWLAAGYETVAGAIKQC